MTMRNFGVYQELYPTFLRCNALGMRGEGLIWLENSKYILFCTYIIRGDPYIGLDVYQ